MYYYGKYDQHMKNISGMHTSLISVLYSQHEIFFCIFLTEVKVSKQEWSLARGFYWMCKGISVKTGNLIFQCAGGLASGLGVTECAIKECQEEGSVDDETLKQLKSAGSIR